MTTATTKRDLFERVEEFLGAGALENEIEIACSILKEKGWEYGNEIQEFWPENMLDLVLEKTNAK